jgi:hypothetical protein
MIGTELVSHDFQSVTLAHKINLHPLQEITSIGDITLDEYGRWNSRICMDMFVFLLNNRSNFSPIFFGKIDDGHKHTLPCKGNAERFPLKNKRVAVIRRMYRTNSCSQAFQLIPAGTQPTPKQH